MKIKNIFFLLFLFSLSDSFGQDPYVDSLEKRLSHPANEADKMQTLDLLAGEYFYVDVNKLEGTAKELLRLSVKKKNKKGEINAQTHLGNYHYAQGNYKQALDYYFKSAEMQKKGEKPHEIANTYLNIGNVYESKGDLKNALKYYLEALKIDEKSGDQAKISDDYSNLGIFYKHMGKMETALSYYQKSLQIDLKMNDERRLSVSYLNLGAFYYADGNLAKSLECHEKAKTLAEKTNYAEMIAKATNNLSELYMEQKDYPKAMKSLKESLEIKLETGNKEGLANTYLNLAMVYKAQKNNAEALKNANLSKQISTEMDYKEGIRDAALLLSEIYGESKDYKQSLDNYKQYSEVRHAMVNDESVAQVAEMQTKYDTEKKEQQIQLLKKEDDNKELKIRSQQAQILTLVFSALLIISFILILYMRYRQKQKRLMAQQLLAEQALRYSSIVEAQENEKVRIARDLHDGVCQKFAATKMKFSNLNEDIRLLIPEKSDKYKDCIRLLDEATSELRTVAHEIMPPALREHDLPEALRYLAEETFDTEISCTFESFGKLRELTASHEINVYRIAQELFANVIKHSGATEVSVQLLGSPDRISLRVEDNGKGLAILSEISKEKGVGISNIELRAQMLNGKFHLESAPGGGTLAILTIEMNASTSQEKVWTQLR